MARASDSGARGLSTNGLVPYRFSCSDGIWQSRATDVLDGVNQALVASLVVVVN